MSGSASDKAVAPAKILVRGVNWLGDAVMTIPALQRLREARPGDSITLLTSEKLADLWQGHPAIDRVISFSGGESVFEVARQVRQKQFDIALILPNSFRSGLEVFLARVPVRIGYARNARGFLLTKRISPRPGEERMRKRSVSEIRRLIRENSDCESDAEGGSVLPNSGSAHHIHNYLHLAHALGAVNEPLPPNVAVRAGEADAFLEKFGLAPQRKLGIPIFGLNPGAEYGPTKRWPPERFVAAAAQIQRLTGCCCLIFGGAEDVTVASMIETMLDESSKGVKSSRVGQVLNLAGKTTLRELCAGLSVCSVVLTNDSGPMHLAAAVGARVVAVFGSTSPALTAPGLPGISGNTIMRVGVPCSPCFRPTCPIDLRCLTRISEQEAIDAVLRVAARRPQPTETINGS